MSGRLFLHEIFSENVKIKKQPILEKKINKNR
jgi:hypothetical protein